MYNFRMMYLSNGKMFGAMLLARNITHGTSGYGGAPSSAECGHFRNGSRFAVGMLIAEHPPHRSGRAQFEHPAPTLGIDGEALIGLPYAAQRLGHANPDLRPVRALLIR